MLLIYGNSIGGVFIDSTFLQLKRDASPFVQVKVTGYAPRSTSFPVREVSAVSFSLTRREEIVEISRLYQSKRDQTITNRLSESE